MNLLVPYHWLKDYVKLKSSPQEFAARLSLSGPSVERIHRQGEGLEKVVVGKILKVKAHPNADKLRVVETDLGSMTKDIVCGGSNLADGQLVAVALPGAWVKWHGEGEPVEIKETKLRGADSYGMICGADEIGLIAMFPKSGEREIVDLTSTHSKPGTPLAEALKLDDVIFDVEVTSNRPDAFSMVGMAREASAILEAPFIWKAPKAVPASGKAKLPLTVKLEAKRLCGRYQAVAMDGVKIGPSPEWLRARLAAAGHRSINNLVDITNYVMLELGQPLHCFDYDKLKGHAIHVREARDGETFEALDGTKHALKPGQLVIADAERPVAVAGVMGGMDSGVTEATTRIVFESAVFDAVSVRRTSRALGLHSDSAQRYEKGLSTEGTQDSLARAVALATELAGAALAGPAHDVRANSYRKLKESFRPAKAEELIGMALPAAKMRRILGTLGFKVSGSSSKWSVEVPWWRDHDIEGERDLVEEVARVHGYGNLPSVLPDGIPPERSREPVLEWEDRAKRLLKGWGCTEVMTYSFVSKELAAKSDCGEADMLRVSNPLSEEFEFMRDRLMGGVLQVVADNQEEYVEDRIFELSNIYVPRKGDLPVESPRLVIAAWSRREDGGDVRAVKGMLEALLRELGVRGAKFERDPGSVVWHPGRTASVKVGGDFLGAFGELHPNYVKRFGIDRRVAAVSLDFAMLASLATHAKSYAPVPQFPRAKRDLAFVVERHVEHAAVVAKLRSTDLLKDLELFDVYEGANLGGKKSLAYHLSFGADDRTLTSDEVERAMQSLRKTLQDGFGAEVRS